MAAKLDKTSTPGVFRRHAGECPRNGRCECSYVVVWRHRGKQHTATFRTLAEAREAKGNRDAGDRRPVARITFGEYFGQWIESYSGRTARGFAERSRDLYRRAAKDHALPRWETWRLADIEPADVRDLLKHARDKGCSTSVLHTLRSVLSALFATAVEDGLLRASPVHGVRIPAAPASELDAEEKAKALTREELTMLLGAVPSEWRLFFDFLTHTGLRISEAVGLTWRHLDLGTTPRVQVREQFYNGQRQRLKSGRSRRDVPLSAGMAERLRAWRRDSYGGDQAPVFPSGAGTELSRPNLAGRVLKPAAEAVGLVRRREDGEMVAWPSFHTFRHTCASLLFDAGKNVKQVQEWLGHADPAFTLRTYVHLLDDGLGDADFLDGLTAGESHERLDSRSHGGCADTSDQHSARLPVDHSDWLRSDDARRSLRD